MGEYADYEIDRIIDWHTGGGRRHRRFENTHKPAPVCKDCGEECVWIEKREGWRLADADGSEHTCEIECDFEPVTDED